MKKTLLAAALLAGFAGAAHAQSSVTLYGIADASFINTKNGDTDAINGIGSGTLGASRFGLRGSEDLGGGLKANFNLENGFNIDNGTQTNTGGGNALFDRAAWVGLSSKSMGELRLGRQGSIGFDWFRGVINPFGNSYLNSQSKTVFDGSALRNQVDDRISNSVLYYTPMFAGFQAGIGYSFAPGGGATESAGNDLDTPIFTSGIRYQNGPFQAALTYDQKMAADTPTPATFTEDIRNLQLGAIYNFGFLKLHAGYGRLENAYGVSSSKGENTYLIGLTVPFGVSTVRAAYQRNDNANSNAGYAKNAINGYSISYDYALSKRTTLYALANYYSHVTANVAKDGTTSQRQLTVGIQHKF